MINANDLKIGNLVTWQDDDEIIYLKVIGLIGEDLWVEDTEGDINDINFEVVRPIPLTPEILGMCGFEGNYKRRFKKIGETPLTIYYENSILAIEDYDWFEQTLNHIQHLHQLQNLYYALTNEELEIKL